MKGNLTRLLLATISWPAIILFHECGHYFAAMAFGVAVHIHFASISVPPETQASVSLRLVFAAGPCVEGVLAIGGFIWLWWLRRHRSAMAATRIDWVATYLAFCAVRWLRCFTGTVSEPKPRDEAIISQFLGFPRWLLPYLLAPAALTLLVAAIRLHPRGSRSLSFACLFTGIVAGDFLWKSVVGPWILP